KTFTLDEEGGRLLAALANDPNAGLRAVGDEGDPTKWQRGDVVMYPLPGHPEGTLFGCVGRTEWPGWRVHWNGGQSWLPDDLARDQGWRRIRRASTEERRG